jgi:hypothetical protein
MHHAALRAIAPVILPALSVALAPIAAAAQIAPPASPPADCGTPAPLADGWDVAAPDAVGFDPVTLCGIGPRFQAWAEANVHSVLVIRHGKLVYERYTQSPWQSVMRCKQKKSFTTKTQRHRDGKIEYFTDLNLCALVSLW